MRKQYLVITLLLGCASVAICVHGGPASASGPEGACLGCIWKGIERSAMIWPL